jgi:hypothetical protein
MLDVCRPIPLGRNVNIYLNTLLESELPFEPWVLIVVFFVLLVLQHVIARSARSAMRQQESIVSEESEQLNRGFEPKYIAGQVVFGLVVFSFAHYVGGAFGQFFSGGLIVAGIFGLGANVDGLLLARALNRTGVVRGSIEMSVPYSFFSIAYRMLGGAVMCLVLGLVLANLALLGGVLFLGSTGIGYLRKGQAAAA